MLEKLRKNQKSSAGFTILELLIVIAVIGLLASILLVSFEGAKERARIAQGWQFSDSLRAALQMEMVAWWPLDKVEGTITPDNWFDRLDGTVSGAQPDDGIVNNALKFNGVDDYVKVSPTSAFSNMNAITLEAWVNFITSPAGTTQEVAQKWKGWTFGYNGSGWWFELYATTNQYIGAYNDTWSPGIDTWYHVASTYDGSTMATFINGKLLASHPGALDNRIIWNNPDTSWLGIGAAGWESGISGRYFKGFIDEVRIYNAALPQSMIQQHYAEGLKRHQNLAKR